MKQKADCSVQARTNPVFLTAKTAVCLMAQAGIPDAAAIVASLGMEANEPLRGMADPDTVLGNAVVVEAKYRTMCRLIEGSGYRTCVDLPCGYTPKALHMTGKGLRFVGLDLPIVVEEVGPVLRAMAAYPALMSFHGVDATNFASLEEALRDVDGPLCITTEGMMMYFTDNEAETVISNVRGLLKAHGGVWITPDPEFMIQFFQSFRSLFGEGALEKLASARASAQAQSNVPSLSNAFILDAADIPGSRKKAVALLERHGLKAEEINLAEHMPALSVYQRLSAEQIRRFEDAMRDCHYWAITLDGARWQHEECSPRSHHPFAMRYALEHGTFRLTLEGRLDSISAPQVLSAWETEKATRAIDGVSVECSGLTYVSSAGARVLLDIREQCSRGMEFSGASPAVAGILSQHGFLEAGSDRQDPVAQKDRRGQREDH